MRLSVRGNKLFADNLMFSHAEVNDARCDQYGSFPVEVRYSHAHERDLPMATGLGWLGADASCAVIVGRVVPRDGKVLPCIVTESRLIGMLNRAEEQGGRCILEIEHG